MLRRIFNHYFNIFKSIVHNVGLTPEAKPPCPPMGRHSSKGGDFPSRGSRGGVVLENAGSGWLNSILIVLIRDRHLTGIS